MNFSKTPDGDLASNDLDLDAVGSDEPRMSRLGLFLILASIFVAAACGIVYELLVGSISSYFLGNSVEQYSLTIGFFLFAMGLGSWISRAVHGRLIRRLVALELWLGLFGGLTVPALYLAYAYTDVYKYLMLVIILIIGTLIGLEIPLLTRILRRHGSLRTILSNVLSVDYVGALVAAVLFPFFCLPVLGAFHTSLVAGALNVLAGSAILLAVWAELSAKERGRLILQGILVSSVLVVFAVQAQPLMDRWEDTLYEGQVVFSTQSKYQKIVVTRWKDETRLFLNEHLQFSSVDEYRYHEALVHPAMALSHNRARVLVIGGGDGLAVREILRYSEVEEIELVDLDPAMTTLARRNLYFTELNRNALSHPRVLVTNEDGFTFLQKEHEPYSVVIIDLPDPREEEISKLFSVEAYRLIRRHLAPGGVILAQATSPYYTRRAYWCIGESMEEAGLEVLSFHAYVPSFGEWGFHLGSEEPIDPQGIEFLQGLRYLNKELFLSKLDFDADMARVEVQPNTLERPTLAGYYREDLARW
jgi:spermidine synthase